MGPDGASLLTPGIPPEGCQCGEGIPQPLPETCPSREIRNVELLKLRFGEAPMHFCEVMLKVGTQGSPPTCLDPPTQALVR
jgi:hypothetical protein